MPPSGYCYYTRRWLNRPGFHAGAYLIASVDDYRSSGSLVLSDCSRLIRLEFDTYNPEVRRNSLHKLNVLTTSLTEMRAALLSPAGERHRSA